MFSLCHPENKTNKTKSNHDFFKDKITKLKDDIIIHAGIQIPFLYNIYSPRAALYKLSLYSPNVLRRVGMLDTAAELKRQGVVWSGGEDLVLAFERFLQSPRPFNNTW